jgi:predicted permease
MPTSPRRFRSRLWKTPVEREIEGELAFHLEMRERDYLARGLEPAAARAAARARLGALEPVRAECRRLGRLRDRALDRAESFAELRQDLRLATRRLLAAPLFAALSVVTLALALAASAATFAAYDALVLRALPFPHPEELVRLRERGPEGGELAVSRSAYLAWAAERRGLSALAALAPADRTVVLPGGGERVRGVAATSSLFPLLGLRAAEGRVLAGGDESRGGDRHVAVLSDRLWRRLGGGWDVAGRTIVLDGAPYAVAGVLPRDIAFPPGADLWTPLPLDLPPARQAGRDRHELAVVARLAAHAAGRLAPPGMLSAPLADWVVGAEGRSRALLALGSALVLGLLASGGVANLLVSRAATRQRELALRAALGAGRGRILRQLATEGALLGIVAAAVALPATTVVLRLVRERFAAISETESAGLSASFAAARLAGLSLDGRALGFLALVAAAIALAIGLLPALVASRVELTGAVRALPPRHRGAARRLRELLVVTEVAAAAVLLVGTGLVTLSFLRLRGADPGFAADRLLVAELALAGDRYPPASRRSLSRTLETRLARLPGVVAVGTTSFAPWTGEPPDPPFVVTSGGRAFAADLRSVSRGFFGAVGLPLLAGRLPASDGPRLEVAVDRSLARRARPGERSLGGVLTLGSPPRDYTVVGVVGDLADVAPGVPSRPTIFIPYPRRPWRTLTLVVRTAGDPALLTGAVRREIEREPLAQGVPPPDVHPLTRGRAKAVAGPRASLLLLLLFATLALAIAGLGIYDLLATAVGERAAEIALRLALGAKSADVLALVLGRGVWLTTLGLAAGLGAAAALAGRLPAILYGTTPTDAIAYAATSLLFIACALAAGLTPARDATRIAPGAALAGE